MPLFGRFPRQGLREIVPKRANLSATGARKGQNERARIAMLGTTPGWEVFFSLGLSVSPQKLDQIWDLSHKPPDAPFSCCWVAKSCPTLCTPTDCSTSGFPVSFTISQHLLKLMSFESVMPSNHLILCHPLLLLPSIFPSIRVFSNELAIDLLYVLVFSSC